MTCFHRSDNILNRFILTETHFAETMPAISMCYGIIIRLYYAPDEHPLPHFHVYYTEHKGSVDIRTCEMIAGNLPRKQTKLVLTWAELHREELLAKPTENIDNVNCETSLIYRCPRNLLIWFGTNWSDSSGI